MARNPAYNLNASVVKWPPNPACRVCPGPATLLKAVPLVPRHPETEWFLRALARGFGDGDGWCLR